MKSTPAPHETNLVELSPKGDFLQRGRPPHSPYSLVEGPPELQALECCRPLCPLGVDPLIERLPEREALQGRRPPNLKTSEDKDTGEEQHTQYEFYPPATACLLACAL